MKPKVTFKVGTKVRAVENHDYLGITKRMVGVVVEEDKGNTVVEFKAVKRKILFQAEELRRVK